MLAPKLSIFGSKKLTNKHICIKYLSYFFAVNMSEKLVFITVVTTIYHFKDKCVSNKPKEFLVSKF